MPETQEHFLVDLKHEVVLYIGDRKELDSHREAVLRNLRGYPNEAELLQMAEQALHTIPGNELDQWSIQYMTSKRRVPRRLIMRLADRKSVSSPQSSQS